MLHLLLMTVALGADDRLVAYEAQRLEPVALGDRDLDQGFEVHRAEQLIRTGFVLTALGETELASKYERRHRLGVAVGWTSLAAGASAAVVGGVMLASGTDDDNPFRDSYGYGVETTEEPNRTPAAVAGLTTGAALLGFSIFQFTDQSKHRRAGLDRYLEYPVGLSRVADYNHDLADRMGLDEVRADRTDEPTTKEGLLEELDALEIDR